MDLTHDLMILLSCIDEQRLNAYQLESMRKVKAAVERETKRREQRRLGEFTPEDFFQ